MQTRCNVRSILTRRRVFDRTTNGGSGSGLAPCSQYASWLASQCARFTAQIRENRISSCAATGLARIHQSGCISRSSVAMTDAPAIDQLELGVSILINPCHAWPLYCQLGSWWIWPPGEIWLTFSASLQLQCCAASCFSEP